MKRICTAIFCLFSSCVLAGETAPITDVRLGAASVQLRSRGDTWDAAWADDDNLYTAGDDGVGWDNACLSNVFFCRVSGDNPLKLVGKTINPLSDCGIRAELGPDGCSWKSAGCISIDGTLYLLIARHKYGDPTGQSERRQTAGNSSIIKSTDHGLTWTRPIKECYDHPMFPGPSFATPYFIWYGKDGTAPAIDRADEFIYAISNDGFWCNGNSYFLGRIKKSDMKNLQASDWQFFTGGNGGDDKSWSKESKDALQLIKNPAKCSMSGATYVPSLGRYVLIAWYYRGEPNTDTDETAFIYYESPHPWGPWTEVREETIQPQGWYSPRILSKWQSGKDGEASAFLVTAGDWNRGMRHYKFTVIPVSLKTNGKYPAVTVPPVTTVKNSETGDGLNQFQYHGSWKPQTIGEENENGSSQANDSFSLKFKGKRLEWYTSRRSDMGMAVVSIDGARPTEVDLYSGYNAPQAFPHARAFDSGTLRPGTHTLTVKVINKKNKAAKGQLIVNETVEITE